MKSHVISLLFVTALVAAPAQAAFVLNCKSKINPFGREITSPVQWAWDGVDLRVIATSHDQELKAGTLKPLQFERIKVPGTTPGVSYSFVVVTPANGIRVTQTLYVYGNGKSLAMAEITGMVSGQGLIIDATRTEYRGCSVKES